MATKNERMKSNSWKNCVQRFDKHIVFGMLDSLTTVQLLKTVFKCALYLQLMFILIYSCACNSISLSANETLK